MPVGATVAAAGITGASILGGTKMQNSASANTANIQARVPITGGLFRLQ